MKSATELYAKPLLKKTITAGDFEIKLCAGLISTIQNFERDYTRAEVIKIGLTLTGVDSRRTTYDRLLRYMQQYLQLEWYRAKGVPDDQIPLVVHDRLKDATTELIIVTDTTESTESTDAPKRARRSNSHTPKKFCRSLIEAGERDEQVLVDKVIAEFPDRRWNIGEVKRQLREAGVLSWTKRYRGKAKQDPIVTAPVSEELGPNGEPA